MSHLDAYGDPGHRGWERYDEPGFRERPDEPAEWARPSGSRDDIPVRARHANAAPDAYPPVTYDQPRTYRDDASTMIGGYPGYRGYDRRIGVYGVGFPIERTDLPPDPGAAAPFHAESRAGAPYVEPGADDGDAHTVTEPVRDTVPPVEREPVKPKGRYHGRRRASGRSATGKSAGTGRAGRNLPAAIGVGVALATAIVAPLFFLRPVFFAVVVVAVAIGCWEMARAVRARDAHPPLVPLIVGGLVMTGLAWRAGPDGLSFGLLVTVATILVWRLADGPAGYQRDVTAAALIAVYVPFLAGFAVLLAVPPDGDWRVLATLAAVVLSDTGGYVVGVFFGKHPMAPSVSPKKSWEGFGGSVGSAAIGSAVLLYLTLDVELWLGAVFGLVVSMAAVLGDLSESMIKRDLGIKDMSNLLPGHGGLMDRLDSILFAVPTAYVLLTIVAPVG